MKNQKIIKICEQKFIYLNYSTRTKDNYLSHNVGSCRCKTLNAGMQR